MWGPLQGGGTFLAKVTAKSPFHLTVMRELAALAATPQMPEMEKLSALHSFAVRAFSGWGQTKVVEDLLQRLRTSETTTVRNAKLMARRQYGLMRDQAVIGLHQRSEVVTDPANLPPDCPPNSTWAARGHEPAFPATDIMGKATWPTLSAQTLQGLPAEKALLAQRWEKGDLEAASSCWRAAFLETGTVLRLKDCKTYQVVLG
eukprot:5364200-Lingulodinium_polyedra.AAC.1